MAASLRTILTCHAIFGGWYVLLETFMFDARYDAAITVPQFLAWHIVMSSIPAVGITGLSVMDSRKVRIFPMFSKKADTRVLEPVEESSFVGTLTS